MFCKLDFGKAFDLFLGPFSFTFLKEWALVRNLTPSFAVIINDGSFSFFQSSRGLS